MPTVTVKFTGQNVDLEDEFQVDSCLEETIQEYVDDYNEEHSEDDEPSEILEWEVVAGDENFQDLSKFDSLKEYVDYIEMCEKHGEAYRLRYDDIGDHDFGEEYMGCWPSAEEYVRDTFVSCHGKIPGHLSGYIDWESLTRDWMMDYSTYEGDDGVHIFRD